MSGPRSNVPIFTAVPARPSTAASPLTALVHSTPVTSRLATAAAILRGVSGASSTTPSTRASPPASCIARASPAQRASRPVLPTCWLTHSACLTPAAARRRPASSPARSSSWPTWASTPSCLESCEPELMLTTGGAGATARGRGGGRAGAHAAGDGGRDRRLRDRDDQPIGLGRDRGVDQLAHPPRAVDVRRAVVDEQVERARGGVGAVADDRPELARGRAMGDDGDPHRAVGPRRLGFTRGCRGSRRDRDAACVDDGGAAAAGGQQRDQQQPLHGHGIRASRRVPAPGGLSMLSVPPTVASRSCSPRSPLPASRSTPPTPAAATSTTISSPSRATSTRALLAWA